LLNEVALRLTQLWSPQAISGRLRLDFPDDLGMRVSHETIYQSLFVQGRGELRRELARCLRSGRTARRHRGRIESRGRLPGMVMLSERPAEADDRAVPGHWEGDLILGAGSRSAVGTLVERSTRFLLLLHLGNDKTAVNVEMSMRQAMTALPEQLQRSITWDRERRWPRMPSSPLPPASRSTSVSALAVAGSAALTSIFHVDGRDTGFKCTEVPVL
jgi:IS30 family transposase